MLQVFNFEKEIDINPLSGDPKTIADIIIEAVQNADEYKWNQLITHPEAYYASRILNSFINNLPGYDNIDDSTVEITDFMKLHLHSVFLVKEFINEFNYLMGYQSKMKIINKKNQKNKNKNKFIILQ
ncbi:hypothetical protein C1645_823940 [Glomus cerebriforme]|uniref:Uncharacterized protein n=1 Tax=Glomus cerebriforme TaxID=658196 RepID=A0A397SVJ9_9GLOM|nr:hypothetical protein C1645_823940 [Glomus cerebriforme]